MKSNSWRRALISYLGRFFPEYGDFLKSITDSPFQEEMWQVLESKNFKDIWELIAYMEA